MQIGFIRGRKPLPTTFRRSREVSFVKSFFGECAELVARASRTGEKFAATKRDGSLITGLDGSLHRLFQSRLRKTFPSDGLLSEESENWPTSPLTGRIWIIDPLDGTTNWNAGVPIFAVSVALAIEGQVYLGGILLPHNGLIYLGLRGKGAYCGLERLTVRRTKRLQFSSIVTFCSWKSNDVGLLNLRCNVRALGSTAYHLALLASGITDGTIELACRPWDFAAGVLLVEEAGGIVATSMTIADWLRANSPDRRVIVVAGTNKLVLNEMRRIVEFR